MSKQKIIKLDNSDVKRTYLKLLLEYKKNLLLYGNGEIIFHDEENYELVNKSLIDKRRKSFKNRDFEIREKHGFNARKQVSQIIDFDKFYFMMKDDNTSSLLAFREENESFVVSDSLVSKDIKKRYMTRDELSTYLSRTNQLIRYNGVWTKKLDVPSEKEILNSFKNYVEREYVENESDEEKKSVLSSLIRNASIESISRGFVFMEDNFLLIHDDNDMSVSYITTKYEGHDWFRVDSRYISLNKQSLMKLRETSHHDNTHEIIGIEASPKILKNIKTRTN